MPPAGTIGMIQKMRRQQGLKNMKAKAAELQAGEFHGAGNLILKKRQNILWTIYSA